MYNLSKKKIKTITLIYAIFLINTSRLYSTSVHTKTLPANLSDRNTLSQHIVYLECESAKNKKVDSISEKDKNITFYRTNASLPNKYWGAYVAYNKSRLAAWGADKRNYSNKCLNWENIPYKFQTGIYDVYINVLITNNGFATFQFKKANSAQLLNTAKFTLPITNKKPNISWIRIGSIHIKNGDDSFTLKISTHQTPIRIDTILLVYIPKKEVL